MIHLLAVRILAALLSLTLAAPPTAAPGRTFALRMRATAARDGSLSIRTVLPSHLSLVDQAIDGGGCGFGVCSTTAAAGETRTLTQTIQVAADAPIGPATIGALLMDASGDTQAVTTTVQIRYLWYVP